MRSVLTFIGVLTLATQAFADLELQSARCLSKDLTLTITMVTDGQVAETKVPNAKGLLSFKANTRAGERILNGREMVKSADLALELAPQINSLTSYTNGEIDLTPSSEQELLNSLEARRPWLYFFNGNLSFLNAKVSYIYGKKFAWKSCDFDMDNVATVKNKSLADIKVQDLTDAAYCSTDRSDYVAHIVGKGLMTVQKTGITDLCLLKIANTYAKSAKRNLAKMTNEEIRDLLQDLMSSIVKAEEFEKGN